MTHNDKHKEEAEKAKKKEQENKQNNNKGQDETKENIQDTFEEINFITVHSRKRNCNVSQFAISLPILF